MKIGLTGGIASGKSTVAAHLVKLGVPVWDADDATHRLYAEDDLLKQQLVHAFGNGILTPNGDVDRKTLGQQVFSHPEQLTLLGQLVHPLVRADMKRFLSLHSVSPVCVAVIPLLYENQLQSFFDEIWLCWVPESVQRQRLVIGRGLSEAEADKRLAAQLPLQKKLSYQPVVINCEQSLAHTLHQVEQRVKPLLARHET